MQLAAARTGSGPRIVLVHGFTQNRRCWGELADDLARDHEVVAVDAPGHGESSEVALDLVGGAAALAATGGPATYLGYSMGGRFCLHVAVHHPEVCQRLVLISATAGIDDPAERAARRASDERLAAELEAEGLDAFLERWLANPLFATLPSHARDTEARAGNTVAGLASSLRLAGTGTQEPLWDALGTLTMPVLLVAGALDRRFVAHAERMQAMIGTNAQLAVVEGAGHAAHRERPDAVVEILRRWLAAHPA